MYEKDGAVEGLKLEPLVPPVLPAGVAGLAKGATAAKLMALRGMAPLRPAELLTAVYQFSFDADATVKAAAEAAPASLPDKIVLTPLGEDLPPQVLHFFAEHLPTSRRQPIEKILFNQATADETFVLLAKNLDEGGLEIIFRNEVRLLRCPALVEALYFNKRARMSSVSRALELCARNHIQIEGIPGYAETAAALMSDPNAATTSTSDEVFTAALSQDDAVAPQAPVLDGRERHIRGNHRREEEEQLFHQVRRAEDLREDPFGHRRKRLLPIGPDSRQQQAGVHGGHSLAVDHRHGSPRRGLEPGRL